MKVTPVLVDANTRREKIYEKAIEGIKNVFPIQNKDFSLETDNVEVKRRDYSSREQKEAILKGNTLQEAIRADVRIKDKNGKVIDEKKGLTIAQLPYFTQRHTFIVNGNEYSVANQRRVKPGVYARVRANEELEAAFNLGRGENFRVNMDPAKGHLFMQHGSTNIPLYPILKNLGVKDIDLAKKWGSGVLKLNQEAFAAKDEASVAKLYERLVPAYKRTAKDIPTMVKQIEEYYKTTQLDPDVTKQTLGSAYSNVTPGSLVDASKKILDIHRSNVDVDDRDRLSYQTFHSVDDFIKERIELEGRNIRRKVATKFAKVRTNPSIDAVLPPSPLTRTLRSFVSTSNLSAIPSQINPIEIIDSALRVTSLGEGGIGTERAVPSEARRLHQTHFGVLDPARTPESFRAGIDLRTSIWTKRDDNGELYTLLRNAKTGKLEDVPVKKIENSTVAFTGETKKRFGVSALKNGNLVSVAKKEVDYELPHPSFLFSPATNTVPMPESSQGNRVTMGAKYSTQAIPLIDREEPLVQVASYNPGRTFERELADLIVPTSPVDGIIKKIDKDYIYIKPIKEKKASLNGVNSEDVLRMAPKEHVSVAWLDDEKTAAAEPLIKLPYDDRFPLASKTYLDNKITVKEGDRVKANQHLAESNFTKNGKLALGKNLNVAYMAYYGANSNDAVVISETGSKKLTSEHMYKEAMPLDNDIELSKNKHKAQFGMRWTSAQYANLDEEGVAKQGATVQPGDPLILAIRKSTPTAEQRALGRLNKTLANPYREAVLTWEHRNAGEIIDVVKTPQRILLTVLTRESAAIGDKISGRYGNKGVISQIIPDDKMVRNEAGEPLDLLMTSAGVVSRVNPAQIIETAVAKVAKKTGEPIAMPSMSGRNNVKWAKELLKKHSIKDKEILFNPVTGKEISGPDGKGVLTGPKYIYKLFKSTETNYSARGIDDYDVNLQPSKGGYTGAKALGRMEINGLLAHNARNVVREAATLKSTRNDEWWRAYQLGQPLPTLKTPFAVDKFANMLTGSGIRVDKSGSVVSLGPLTDNDINKLSSGKITKATMIREKDLAPEKGGLFDPVVTGGLNGDRWGHIDLAEPMVNPIFEDPVRRLLGMTKTEFRKTLYTEGGENIKKRLDNLNLKEHKGNLENELKEATGSKLDNVVKQLKTIDALEKQKLKPSEAYILKKFPVVPPVVRPILPSRGKRDLLVSDPNYLYRDTILANDTLGMAKKALPLDEVKKARASFYDAAKAVFGLEESKNPQLKGRATKGFIADISGQGSPKRGFFHAKVLTRNQDLSARGTIIPDLTLDMDQVGLPEDMLWKTYSPHLMRGLVQQGYRAMEAKEMVENQHPTARDVLLREIKTRPVIVNRAPTLHRFGIVGAYPVPVPGKTIRINPFIEKGFNADYDGDSADCTLDTFIDTVYTRLHISQFPHIKETRKMKDNKEYFDVPEKTYVFSYDAEANDIRLKPVTGFSIHHDLEMVKVKLSSGRTVKVSKDASLFAMNPDTWELQRVCAKDAVGWATPRPRTLHFENNDMMGTLTYEFGWFLGALTGKGWFMWADGRLKGVGFASIHEPLRHRFTDFASSLVPELSRRDYGSQHDFRGYDCYSEKTHLNSAELGRILYGFGLTYRHAPEKFLPSCFIKAPRDFHLGLLSGLLDTDGSITEIKAKAKNKPQWLVNYSTSSTALADHISLLATFLGVRSSINHDLKKDSYTITFSMPDIVRIAPELSLSNPTKADNLKRLVEDYEPNPAVINRGDCIPVNQECIKLLATMVGSPKKRDTPEKKEAANLYGQTRRGLKDGRITRDVFKRLADRLGVEALINTCGEKWFKHASNETLFWDFIDEYEVLPGRHTAWDITVPGSCTFMTSNQVVIYDTVQIHVPVSEDAKEDVKAMTLSNLLFGDRTKNSLMVFPEHEAILGIHTASAASGGKRYKFKTKQEALTAYKQGKIKLNDIVDIG